MASLREKKKFNLEHASKLEIGAIEERDPNQLIEIKTSRIYSQIARVSRNPNRIEERAILISALESAYIKIDVNGKTIKKDPPFVPMKAYDAKLCFGKRLEKVLESTFLY